MQEVWNEDVKKRGRKLKIRSESIERDEMNVKREQEQDGERIDAVHNEEERMNK